MELKCDPKLKIVAAEIGDNEVQCIDLNNNHAPMVFPKSIKGRSRLIVCLALFTFTLALSSSSSASEPISSEPISSDQAIDACEDEGNVDACTAVMSWCEFGCRVQHGLTGCAFFCGALPASQQAACIAACDD